MSSVIRLLMILVAQGSFFKGKLDYGATNITLAAMTCLLKVLIRCNLIIQEDGNFLGP